MENAEINLYHIQQNNLYNNSVYDIAHGMTANIFEPLDCCSITSSLLIVCVEFPHSENTSNNNIFKNIKFY